MNVVLLEPVVKMPALRGLRGVRKEQGRTKGAGYSLTHREGVRGTWAAAERSVNIKSKPDVKLRSQQSRSRGGHHPLLFGGLESIVPFGQSKCAVERCA